MIKKEKYLLNECAQRSVGYKVCESIQESRCYLQQIEHIIHVS